MKDKLPDDLLKEGVNPDGLDLSLKKREVRGDVRTVRKLKPIRRNIDWSPIMYREIEDAAVELGITNQALVKAAVLEYLKSYQALKEGKNGAQEYVPSL